MPGLVLTFALSLLILSHCPLHALANTEIVNFSAGNLAPVTVLAPFPANWTSSVVLNAGTPEIIVRDITPAPLNAPCKDDDAPGECPHDLWLTLDLGTWAHHDHFTLRVSWPASHPAAVTLSVHTAQHHHLAHVRLTEEGVRVPHTAHNLDLCVPLVVRLEPLLVRGVLPQSVMPVIATLLLVLGTAAYGVLPHVLRVVEDAVGMARRELEMVEKRKDA